MKRIFIINGSGGAGKDTFVSLIGRYVKTLNYSSVDMVKIIAYENLGWDCKKDEKGRKLLSELKRISSEYNDAPFEYLRGCVKEFEQSDYEFCFLHIREPKEIERAKKEFDAITVLVKNEKVAKITTNDSDRNVDNYCYDSIILNNGTISDLNTYAKLFVDEFKKENENDR